MTVDDCEDSIPFIIRFEQRSHLLEEQTRLSSKFWCFQKHPFNLFASVGILISITSGITAQNIYFKIGSNLNNNFLSIDIASFCSDLVATVSINDWGIMESTFNNINTNDRQDCCIWIGDNHIQKVYLQTVTLLYYLIWYVWP